MSKKEASRITLSRREFLTALGTTAGLAALQAGCAPIATPAPTQPPAGAPKATAAPVPTATVAVGPRYGGTMTTAQTADIAEFFPLHLDGRNWPYFNQLFNVLARYDGNLQPQPELAESWELGEDGLSLTLNLRKGVLFHNGREFVAEDVARSMEVVKDESRHVNIRPLSSNVESVEAKDKYTAVMHFSAPTPAIFDLLDLFFIMAHESFDEIDSNPIGTGPFKLDEWIPGEQARFVKFEDYWREGRPYLDEVIVRVMPDIETQLANLETGEVNMLFPLPTTHFDRVNEIPGLLAFTGTNGALVYNFLVNCAEEPTANKKVRQALQWAVNREKMVELAYGGIGEPWIQPVPRNSLAFDADLEGYYSFDLDRAKGLIAEAGYPDGFDLEFLAGANYPEFVSMAEILQADLAKIGVNVNINTLEPAAVTDRRTKPEGWHMASFFYGRAQKDPASLFGTAKVWFAENNNSFYSNDEYERLINEGARTVDPEKRREIYQQLARLILDDPPAIVVSPRLSVFAINEKLKDLRYNLDDMMILEDAWLEA